MGSEPPGAQDPPGEGTDPAWFPGGDFGSQTSGEIRVTIDQALESSLREFDDKLMREQVDVVEIGLEAEESSAEREEETASGFGGGGGVETRGSAYSEGGGDGRPARGGGGLPGTAGGGGGGPSAADPGERSGRIPPGIPDGRDDDIVARQLREAAMNEENPELRAKLWLEYRKYKTGYEPERAGKKEEKAGNPEDDAGDGGKATGENNAGDPAEAGDGEQGE